MRLDPAATFHTFVPGRSNARATDLARRAVGGARGRLGAALLVGPSGSGKSHLLQAAANEVLRRTPSARVLVLAAEEFRAAYIAAIRSARVSAFRRSFAVCDALFVDQLEDLRAMPATRDELASTIRAVLSNRSPVLLATGETDAVRTWSRAIFGTRSATLHAHSATQRRRAIDSELRHASERLPAAVVNDLARTSRSIVEAKQAMRRALVMAQRPSCPPDMAAIRTEPDASSV